MCQHNYFVIIFLKYDRVEGLKNSEPTNDGITHSDIQLVIGFKKGLSSTK